MQKYQPDPSLPGLFSFLRPWFNANGPRKTKKKKKKEFKSLGGGGGGKLPTFLPLHLRPLQKGQGLSQNWG